MRESTTEILKSLKELTNQQMALTNEIMRLKRELAGRPVVWASGCRDANINDSLHDQTITAIENTTSTATKKRGRGRPRKDVETVSSLAPTTCDVFIDRNCYNDKRDNNDHVDMEDVINVNNDLKTLRYVLEGGELFFHNPGNGRLFDIETRVVVGRYNLYLDRIDWL